MKTFITFTSQKMYFELFRSIKEIAIPLLQICFVILATITMITTLETVLQFLGNLFDAEDFGLVFLLKYLLWPIMWILGLNGDGATEVRHSFKVVLLVFCKILNILECSTNGFKYGVFYKCA